jgi:hypothetical protein
MFDHARSGAVRITTAPFAAIFSTLKQMFRPLTSSYINFKQIDTRNKKKKFLKYSLQVQKCFKKYKNFRRWFFLSLFLTAANNFRQILNHILIGLYLPMPSIKNQRGF